jgi:hypothetical protein
MTEIEQHKKVIADAAALAGKVIAEAAALASKEVARVVAEASKVIQEAAAVSVKVLNLKSQDDHDLLIELRTRMEGIKVDIKDMRDNTSVKIDNHESRISTLETRAEGNLSKIIEIRNSLLSDVTDYDKRIGELETNKTSIAVKLTIGIGLLAILTGMLIYHLFGIKI